MKNKLIIILIGLFLFPIGVLADMGMPGDLSTYEAFVTNINGASIYVDEGTYNNHILNKIDTVIPYGEKITAHDSIYLNGYAEATYKGKSGLIKQEDILGITDSISFLDGENGYNDTDRFYNYIHKVDEVFYSIDGEAYMYTGPSYAFDKASNEKIPANTELTATYAYNNAWHYVEYNGVKGWIFSSSEVAEWINFHCSFAKKYDLNRNNNYLNDYKENYVIEKETVLYKNIWHYTEVARLKPGTKVVPTYYYSNQYGDETYVYLKSDFGEGWVNLYGEKISINASKREYFYAVDGSRYNLYNSVSGTKLNKTLESNKVYKITRYLIGNVTISYGGPNVVGWVKLQVDDTEYWVKYITPDIDSNGKFIDKTYEMYNYFYNGKLTRNATVYSSPLDDAKAVGTINEGEEINYSNYYIMESRWSSEDGQISYYYIPDVGFIKDEVVEYIGEAEKPSDNSLVNLIAKEKKELEESMEESKEESQVIIKDNSKYSKKEILTFIVICTVIIAATSLVTLGIVNSKNKKEEVKAEIEEQE